MIRINLLKNAAEKRRPGGRKKNAALGIAAGAVFLAIVAAGGMWGFKALRGARTARPAPEVKRVVRQDMAPSTYASTNMVEEVVKEVNDNRLKLRESGMLDLPYDQLSFTEKINYEFLFTKNVCEMLSRICPAGISLKSLEINDFQTVYAVGLGSARAAVEPMLSSLKNEKMTVLPPPYSFVKPAGKDGLRFAFSCQAATGLI